MSIKERIGGERTRIRQQIQALRDTVRTVESTTDTRSRIGFDLPQNVLSVAGALSSSLTRLSAYQLAAEDEFQPEEP